MFTFCITYRIQSVSVCYHAHHVEYRLSYQETEESLQQVTAEILILKVQH